MSSIEDPQNKAHKLNYLFSYLFNHPCNPRPHYYFFTTFNPNNPNRSYKNTPLTPPLTKKNPIEMHDVKTPQN
jgi:hypothetical protein